MAATASMERISSKDVERSDVTVIVVNYNTAHLLDRMFKALESGQGPLKSQVVVVDNASCDRSSEFLCKEYPNVEVIENSANVGFGRANNQALHRARGRYVLLLNTDAFISPGGLAKAVVFMDAHPRCGVLGAKLIGSDGALQPSCRYFPTPWNVFLASTGLFRFFPRTRLVDDMVWDHASVRDCDWVPGCFYLIKREVIDRIGLFDPRYFLYYEEVDHCRAVRKAGWGVVYYPFTEVTHIGGESAKSTGPLSEVGRQISALQIESELLYFRKHHGVSGVLKAVVLGLLGDVLTAGNALRNRTSRASEAWRHAKTVLTVLVQTRFASRPTR